MKKTRKEKCWRCKKNKSRYADGTCRSCHEDLQRQLNMPGVMSANGCY